MPSISIPTAIIASGAIAGGAALIGGSMQAGAATSAAQLQADAAKQAAAMQWAMFQQMQGNLAPYMATGANAMNNLAMLTGNAPMQSPQQQQLMQQLSAAKAALAQMGGGAPGTGGTGGTPGMQAVAGYDPQSEHSSGNLADMAMGWGGGGNFLESALGANNRSAIGDIWGALNANPNAQISDASWAAAGFGPGGATLPGAGTGGTPNALGLVGATGGLPGGTAGPTSGGAIPGVPGQMPTDKAGLEALISNLQGQINQGNFSATPGNPLTAPLTAPFNPTMAQLEATPGYQFTLNQGLKATQNAATAQGLGQSGPALAGAADYATGLASTTYQQQFQNYWTNNMNLYNMVSGLATMGQNAAAGVGSAGLQVGNNVGNLLTGGASALGAGQVGAANAWAGGLGSVAGAGQNAMMMMALRNNGLFGGGTPPAVAALGPGGNYITGPGGFAEQDTGGFMGVSGY